jgi:hypothetical protein
MVARLTSVLGVLALEGVYSTDAAECSLYWNASETESLAIHNAKCAIYGKTGEE